MPRAVEPIPIYDSRRLPWPIAWTGFFNQEGPLLVEIGFGHGEFLLELAASRPGANVLGIEISHPSLATAARKAATRRLHNVRLIYGQAQQILWSHCRPGDVAELYINFPDPWPKAAHEHRRLLDATFLHLLATRMLPGARLDVATDHPAYAEAITTLLLANPYFDSRLAVPFVTTDDERQSTKYELKALAANVVCHYYKWQRNQTSAPDLFPVPQELSMPHTILHAPLSLEEIAAQFESQTYSTEEHAIRLISLYYAQDYAMLLVDVFIEEKPVAQRVGLAIRPRLRQDRSELVVSVHDIGFPRPTPGLHAAVHHLTQWLLARHPDFALCASNLQLPG